MPGIMRRKIATTAMALAAASVIAGAFAGLTGDSRHANVAWGQSPSPSPAPSPTAASTSDSAAAVTHARLLLAARLVNHAYDRTRDTATATPRISREIAILLQEASKLDPTNLHTLKLLAEAARNSSDKNPELLKDTLHKLIQLDPGDLVAQVQCLDLIADAGQSIDDRARVYQAALDAPKLDPQIRSQMAVRLARIQVERAELDQARITLRQAIQLNDVNVEALRELARLSARDPAPHLQAILALLKANPYQPDAWLGAAGILAAAGLHDRAADFLNIGLEQMYLSTGQPGDGSVYLQFALELAAAGRTAEAYPILRSLSSLPDAPLSALMAAELLSAEYSSPTLLKKSAATMPAPGPSDATMPASPAQAHPEPPPAPGGGRTSAPATASAPAPELPLADRLLKRLTDSIAAHPKSAPALAEAIWIEFSAMPEVAPETADWLKQYAALVPAGDPTLARLTGWQSLRAGKLDEAVAALEKLPPSDALARLGVARALVQQNKLQRAARVLQELWAGQPTGLLAFQVAQVARQAHLTLAPSALAAQLQETLKTLPSTATVAHRSPREQELVSVTLDKRDFDLAEPVMLNVRLTNTTDHAVPVGPGGVIKTTVGFTAGTRGLNPQFLGLYLVEDLQRVYRLDSHVTLVQKVRADVGSLGDFFQANPMQDLTIGIDAVTAPRGTPGHALPGLGGEQVGVGEFEREGVVLRPDVVTKLIHDAPALPLDQRMVRLQIVTAMASLPDMSGPGKNPDETRSRELTNVLRLSAIHIVQDECKSPSPLMRAWMLQIVPPNSINDDIQATLDGLGSDADPLVRIVWTIRQVLLAHDVKTVREPVLARLEKMAAGEKDPLVKEWMTMMAADERARPAAVPATAP